MGGRESQIKKYVLVQKEVARLGDRGREVTEVSGPEHLPLRPGRPENSPNLARQGVPCSPSSCTATRQPRVIGFLKPWAKLRAVGSQMGGNEISRHQTPGEGVKGRPFVYPVCPAPAETHPPSSCPPGSTS